MVNAAYFKLTKRFKLLSLKTIVAYMYMYTKLVQVLHFEMLLTSCIEN